MRKMGHIRQLAVGVALATPLLGTGMGVILPSPASAVVTVPVSVGYADNLRSSPNLPTPWSGSPNINFLGNAGPWDAGAIRLDNPSASAIVVDSVSVDLQRGGTPGSGPIFNLWGSFTIPANGSTILTQNAGYNFDTSDFPYQGCGSPAPPSDPRIPLVTVTIGGSPSGFLDTGHILDTGAIDTANCGVNESLAWRSIGGAGTGNAGATCTESPLVRTISAGRIATVEGHAFDAGGAPLANATMNFTVTSGPNAGLTGTAVTDSKGVARFRYSSAAKGTDIVAGDLPNVSGGTVPCSNTVQVKWQ